MIAISASQADKKLQTLVSEINNADPFAVITLPSGTTDVAALGADGLVISGKEWVTLQGHTKGSRLTNSLANGRVITIRNSAMCRLKGPFGVDAPTGGVGVRLEWDGVSTFNTLGNHLTNLQIRGGQYGVQIGTGYWHSTSENRVEECQISNQTTACICVDTQNGQNNWVVGGYTIGAPVGILVRKGVIHTALGTTSVIHSDCVIKYLDTPLTASSYHGHYTEQSPKFLDIPGPTGQRAPMTLIGCQLYCGVEWGDTSDVIINRGIGPMTILGCEVGIKGFPCRIVADGGAHTPMAVIGTVMWDNGMSNFYSQTGVAGFNVQSCVNMYTDDSWATALARPFFANEDGVVIVCVSNTQKDFTARTIAPFAIRIDEWFHGAALPYAHGAFTIDHPAILAGGAHWFPQE